MNTQNYLYYDTTDNEWKPATLEELAMLNEPNLPVCEINPDGTPGPQTTYSALETRTAATAATLKQKNTPKPAPAPPAAPAPQPAPTTTTAQETPAERDRRYTYRLVRVCCSFITATLVYLLYQTNDKEFLSNLIVIGLIALAILAVSHDYKRK